MAGKNVKNNPDNYEGMKNVLKLNLDTFVTVSLTEYGKQVLKEYYMKLYENQKFYIKEGYGSLEEYVEKRCITLGYKKDGYYQFQLYDLMNIFGTKTYMGNQPVFEDNNIYFSETKHSLTYGAERVSDEVNTRLFDSLDQV